MRYNYTTASWALPSLANDLIRHGSEVGSRNGRVKELLNVQISLSQPTQREILCEGRGANIFAQIAETMWVLGGRNDIEWLSAYLPRAKDYSDDGKTWRAGYGPRIRNHRGLDQLAYVVDTLKKDPLSRQAVIQIWDADMDAVSEPIRDRACNTQLQFQNRLGELHLTVTVRSNDLMWGWSGINAFEWSTLQEIVAHLLGISVGTLTFNIGNLHVYEPHWQRAGRISFPAPADPNTVSFHLLDDAERSVATLDWLIEQWFVWESMCREGTQTWKDWYLFEEPLFKAWAAMIAYYWSRDKVWLEVDLLRGTALAAAVAHVPASVLSEAPQASHRVPVGAGAPAPAQEAVDAFYEFVADLHAAKHKSYGDSWKKRGESLSILANMARKVDRLGVGDQYDSSADTLIDLLVYSVKYEGWLHGRDDTADNVDKSLGRHLNKVPILETALSGSLETALSDIVDDFDIYCDRVNNGEIDTAEKQDFMFRFVRQVVPVAFHVWVTEEYTNGDDYRGADRD